MPFRENPATAQELQKAFRRLQLLFPTGATWRRLVPSEEAWHREMGSTGRGSETYLDKNLIVLGPKAHVSDLIHEYAHVIAQDLHDGHGAAYCKALESVSAAFYGDVTKYPWDEEYAHLVGYAYGKGYINSPLPLCKQCLTHHGI